jgi:hypothetical protein
MVEAGSIRRDLVVVGASAGGVGAMIGLFEKPPADLQPRWPS